MVEENILWISLYF